MAARALGALGGAPRAVHDIAGRGGLGPRGGARAWSPAAGGLQWPSLQPPQVLRSAAPGSRSALTCACSARWDHVVQPGPVAHRQVDDAILRALQHAAGEAELAARARGCRRAASGPPPRSGRAPRAREQLRAWPEQPGGESADLDEPLLGVPGDRECPPGLPPAAEESPGALGMEVLPVAGNPVGGLGITDMGDGMGMGMGTGRGTITGYGTSKVGVAPAGRKDGSPKFIIWGTGTGHLASCLPAGRGDWCWVRQEAVGAADLGFPGMVGVLGGWMWGDSRAGAWGWRWGPGSWGRLGGGPDAGEHGVGQGCWGWRRGCAGRG